MEGPKIMKGMLNNVPTYRVPNVEGSPFFYMFDCCVTISNDPNPSIWFNRIQWVE